MGRNMEQKAKRKRVSANQVRIAVRRLKNGEKARKVAEELGVSLGTVGNWKKKAAQRKYRTHNKTGQKITPMKRGTEYSAMTEEMTKRLKNLEKEAEALRKIIKITKNL
jgi:transposase